MHKFTQITSMLVFLAASTSARATPLDVAACEGAKQEQATMADVPPMLERGPEWGKANLAPNALNRVARWIELTEILSFRCGRGVVTPEARRAAAAADLIENPPPEPQPPAPSTLNPGQAIPVPTVPGQTVAPPALATAPPPAAPADASEAAPKPARKAKLKSKSKPESQGDASAPAQDQPAADTQPPRKRRTKPAAAATEPAAEPAPQ